MNFQSDFMLEGRLAKESPELSGRFRNAVSVLFRMLDKYLYRFPTFTDHSLLHSMDVLDYCNQIIGWEQIRKLNPQECYALIMSCCLHDVGMGIGGKDYLEFSEQIDFGDYFQTHDRNNEAGVVRDFHNEYSGLFIRKYADLLDIPSEELLSAIVQISRGHRKTDLFDDNEYADIRTENAVIRTAYLSAVLRIADEIDWAYDRNPKYLFDISSLTDERDIMIFQIHESIRRVEVTEDAVILWIKPESEKYISDVERLRDKIQDTLLYCHDVAESRSDLRIFQNKVVIRRFTGQK